MAFPAACSWAAFLLRVCATMLWGWVASVRCSLSVIAEGIVRCCGCLALVDGVLQCLDETLRLIMTREETSLGTSSSVTVVVGIGDEMFNLAFCFKNILAELHVGERRSFTGTRWV